METPSQTTRVAAVQQLGYTNREAEFLVLAALHSGAFVTRHWAYFIGSGNGFQRHLLTSKLIRNRDARTFPSVNKTLIYQLGKRLFTSIGETDNRHRRLAEDSLTRRRMMCLDFRHPQPCGYLATEAEKWNYFHHNLGLPESVLPGHEYTAARPAAGTTQRFFVSKFPVLAGTSGTSFIYADVDGSKASFETFLANHRALFAALENATLIFVTSSETSVLEAQRVLDRNRRGMADAALELIELDILFRERKGLESRIPSQLSMVELKRLRELRGGKNSELFPAWEVDGLATLRAETERRAREIDLFRLAFQPCLMRVNYGFLGVL